MVLSRRTYRRMNNMKDFCDFDTKNETATLHINYQCVDEIIDDGLSTPNEPVICFGAIERLEEFLEYVPKEFKVNFQIRIEDYKGYNPKEIETSYNKAMEIRERRESKEHSNKGSQMGIFIVIGLVILLFMVFNSKNKWFAAAGLPISATIAFVLELFFELHFEEGMTHFVIAKMYDLFGDEERIAKISII